MPGPGMEIIGKEEIEEVMDVLKSQWLYRYGEVKDPNFKQKVIKFEKAVCELRRAWKFLHNGIHQL